MKKIALFSSLVFFFASCWSNNRTDNTLLKQQLDSLKDQVGKLKPGLGEYMLSVQMHHNKLWFAGKPPNWLLAKFEIDEIREQFANAEAVETDRPEIKLIHMIYPALDSVDIAIARQDTALFRKQYIVLTRTCNDCHTVVKYEFNMIKVPDNPMFTNQTW